MGWKKVKEGKLILVEGEGEKKDYSTSLADMEGHAPAFHGRCKPGMKHQCTVWKADPYNDCKEQFRRLENAGAMTPEMAKQAEYKLQALKAQTDSGQIKVTDFGRVGHPLEKDGQAD